MNTCPDRERLRWLLTDALPNDLEPGLTAHVEGCAACQRVLDQLTDFQTEPLPPDGSAVCPEAGTWSGPASVEETKPPLGDGPLGRLRPLLSARPAPVAEPAAVPTADWPTVPGYEIVRALGRGGMAVVYAARDLRLNRPVALKMIRAEEPVTPEQLIRFRAEAETVARLRHPHIVQIFEVGSYHQQPYFALELMEGGSLAEALAGQPLAARPAAVLVETLARTIAYAHQQGVVHRDLKPANILLQRDEGRGARDEGPDPSALAPRPSSLAPIAKIADFGLAKHEGQGVRLTQTGHVMGTPSYMAPEQVRGEHEWVGPATDVYALGAILYELLTGRPPFLAATPLEIMAQVERLDPVPPSRLSPQVPRDLETISLKCLEKEPARRYASATALADDLRRFLDGKPVLARPLTAPARAWRWAKRRPAVAGLLLAVVAVLLGGIGVSTWFAVAAQHAEAEARGTATALAEALAATQAARADEAVQRRQAEQERDLAAAVTEFLRKDLLAPASPYAENTPERRADLKLRTVLDRAAERLKDRFPDQPLVAAALHQTVGAAYLDLGELEQAQRHLESALDTQRRLRGPEHADTLATQNELAALYRERGHYAQSEPLLLQGLEISRRLRGPEHPETLAWQSNLALLYVTQGQYARAEPLYQQNLEVLRRRLGADHPDALADQNHIALLYLKQHRLAEAEPLLDQALEAQRRRLGAGHPDTLKCQNNLATVYQSLGRLDRAESLYREGLEAGVRRLGPDHPITLMYQNGLGALCRARRRYAEAEPLLTHAVEGARRQLGADHPDTLHCESNLARLYFDQGQAAKAEPLLAHVLEARRRTLGAAHPDTLNALRGLVAVYQAEGRDDQAEPLFVEAVAVLRGRLGNEHPDVAEAVARFGENLLRQQKYTAAESALRESLAIRLKVLPADSAPLAINRGSLAASLAGQKKFAEAEPLLLAAYEGLKAQTPTARAPGQDSLAQVLARLIELYGAWGKPDQADRWRKELHARKPSPSAGTD
jgi:serine/threonine protein kinase/tetratricopeptide (TPR) repeat protein